MLQNGTRTCLHCRLYFRFWVAVCFFLRTSACAKRFTWKWLDFHANERTGDIYFIPIVSHKDLFCHRGESKLGIRLFIHEQLRESLIFIFDCLCVARFWNNKENGAMRKSWKKRNDKLNYTKFSCKAPIELEINLPSSTSQPIFN